MIAEKTGVQHSAIASQIGLKKAQSSVNTSLNGADVINVMTKYGAPTDKKAYLDKTRALLLSTLFYDQKLFGEVYSKLSADMFEKHIHKVIYSYIENYFRKGEKVSNTALINMLETEDDIQTACGILAMDIQSDDNRKAVNDYINEINGNAGLEKAYELLKDKKISLEEFNEIIKNKG